MKRQTGFTLIELITVIVILGALAVIALPQYIDLQDEANQAAVEGVAGSLGAAAATNLAGALATDGTEGVSVTSCGDVSSALAGQALPANYSINTINAFPTTPSVGDAADCEAEGPEGDTAQFTAYYVS